MTSQFILWGLPGFVAYYFLQAVKPGRTKSGWDFVVEVGLLAIMCYVAANATIYYGAWFFPGLTRWGHLYWPREYSFALALGLFPISEIVGISLAKGGRVRAGWMSKYHQWTTGKPRNFEFPDVWFATCDELLGEMALFTLKSGKVYVGILQAATQDPNETKRYLRVIPVLSGYRKSETLLVAYTTFYDPAADPNHHPTADPNHDPAADPKRAFLIPADEVVTMAPFDFERLRHFLTVGTVTFEIPPPSPPTAPVPTPAPN